MDKDKDKVIRVDEKTHKEAKLKAVREGLTLKQYVEALIKKDLKQQSANNS